MKKISLLFAFIIGLIGSILYPYFLLEGYLDNWYLKIGLLIPTYGLVTATILYYLKFIKK